MKYILTIALVFLSCLLYSCGKEANPYMIVSGRMIDSTTGQPITYTTFVLYCVNRDGFPSEANVQKIPINTDRNGNFSSFFTDDGFQHLTIVWPDDAPSLLSGIPGNEIVFYNKPIEDGAHKIDLGDIKTSLKKRL